MGKNKRLKNILITGGAGFIGSKAALRLLEEGYAVTVLDALSPQIHGENPEADSPIYKSIVNKVKFFHGDVTVRADVEKALKRQDVVLHFAAETGTGQSMYKVSHYTQTNVGGTALLLDCMINSDRPPEHLILASSRAVYGEGSYLDQNGFLISPPPRSVEKMRRGQFEMTDDFGKVLTPAATAEDAALNPVSLYGLTKLQQEQLVEQVCRNSNINFTIFRFQNVYGAGQSLRNPYTGILSVFSTQLLEGKPINIFEDGLPARDFVHVNDVCEAISLLLKNNNARNLNLNIGTGTSVTVLEVAQYLAAAYGKVGDFEITGDFRLGDIRHNCADLTKAREHLQFEPKIRLEEGLKEFTAWVQQQPIKDNGYQHSLQEMRGKGFLKS